MYLLGLQTNWSTTVATFYFVPMYHAPNRTATDHFNLGQCQEKQAGLTVELYRNPLVIDT